MAQQYTNYITRDGDRWDLISQFAYGDPFKYVAIIAANPAVPISMVLDAGIEILIPIIVTEVVTTTLPPWKL